MTLLTPLELHTAQVEAVAKRLAKNGNVDWKVYLALVEEAMWEASEVVRKAGYVLVPESAISPVREAGED